MLALLLLQTPLSGPQRVAEAAVSAPQPAVSADGHVYVAYARSDGKEVRVACAGADGGFPDGAPLPEAEIMAGGRRGPRIACAGGRVCVTAIGAAGAAARDGSLLAWSSDDGVHFNAPVVVSDAPAAAREGLHAMASTGVQLGCAWLDGRGGGAEIRAAWSRDGGRSWSASQLVYRSPSGHVCECCAPVAAYDPQGTFLVLFRNWKDGCRDMWLARGGAEPFTADKLGHGRWMISACPMAPGGLCASADGLVSYWPREDHVYRCLPGGREQDLGRGSEVTAAGGAAAWIAPGAEGELRVLRAGAAQPETLARHARWPVLAAAPGGGAPLVLAWEVHSAEPVALRLQALALPQGR